MPDKVLFAYTASSKQYSHLGQKWSDSESLFFICNVFGSPHPLDAFLAFCGIAKQKVFLSCNCSGKIPRNCRNLSLVVAERVLTTTSFQDGIETAIADRENSNRARICPSWNVPAQAHPSPNLYLTSTMEKNACHQPTKFSRVR